MRASLQGLLGILSATALSVACAGNLDEEATSGGAEGAVTVTDDIFGDDRVADLLRKSPEKIPGNFQQAEALFGVGRHCARVDSKEVFVVEEARTRGVGGAENTASILPRAVITGCNTPDQQAPASVSDPHWGSYSLMMALFSSPRSLAAAKGDPFVFDRVEVMAMDRRSGLYNFYVFTPGPDRDKGPGVMQRIRLMPDNTVMVYEKRPSTAGFTKGPASGHRECYDCHLNGAPLMNEMSEPWTNWVSTHNRLPHNAKLSGDTRALVSESVDLDGTHTRVSFANDLEKIMTAAIAAYVDGLPKSDGSVVAGTGLVQANIDGQHPEQIQGLLRSVFCETELKYATGFETAPLELFAEPAIFGSALLRPSSVGAGVVPHMMPVRSEVDKRIERGLMKKGAMSFATLTAIRLLDDENDIFSAQRCELYSKVTAGLPKTVDKVDGHLRTVLRQNVEALIPEGPRRAYVQALLDDQDKTRVSKARAAYLEQAVPRIKEKFAMLQQDKGLLALREAAAARKDKAARMFPGVRSPLPILSSEF